MTGTGRNLESEAQLERSGSCRTKPSELTQSRRRLEKLCSASGVRLGRDAKRNVPVFTSEREAALALLTLRTDLAHKEAGLCGHLCVAASPSEKQVAWLASILAKYGLPALKTQQANR